MKQSTEQTEHSKKRQRVINLVVEDLTKKGTRPRIEILTFLLNQFLHSKPAKKMPAKFNNEVVYVITSIINGITELEKAMNYKEDRIDDSISRATAKKYENTSQK